MKTALFLLVTLMAVSSFVPVYGLAAVITLSATDDAFVLSSNPTWNYGGVSNLLVSKAFAGQPPQLTGERQTYIKFDLTSLAGINPAHVTSVRLRLYVTTTAGGQVEAYHSTDNWEEGNGLGQSVPGITWDNRPSLSGEPLMGTSPPLTQSYAYYTIDLLANGNSWLASDLNDNYLSVALLLPGNVNTSTAYYFCGKEANPAVCEGPSLEVQTLIADVFSDIPINYWAYDYVMAIYNVQITAGCSQEPPMYCPENNVTREQMAVFIIRAMEEVPLDGYCGATDIFSDVSFDRWSCKYIKRLVELEITAGIGQGMFGPEDVVTREQMAVFMTRALDEVPLDGYCGTEDPFTDVPYSWWSCKYIKRLMELGITAGIGEGLYGPGNPVTRAQMAVFLSRAFLGM